MIAFTDLNEALPEVLANGNAADAERLVACALSPRAVFSSLIESKRYDLLKVFLPLLQIVLELDPSTHEQVDSFLARAILDNDREGVKEIKLHLDEYLYTPSVAFYCGSFATGDLPEIGEDYDAYSEYREGIVSVDNLDLLLTSEVRLVAGSKPLLKEYVFGALDRDNLDTIAYLSEKVKKKEILQQLLKEQILVYAENLPVRERSV